MASTEQVCQVVAGHGLDKICLVQSLCLFLARLARSFNGLFDSQPMANTISSDSVFSLNTMSTST